MNTQKTTSELNYKSAELPPQELRLEQSFKSRVFTIRNKTVASAVIPVILTLLFAYSYYPNKYAELAESALMDKLQLLTGITSDGISHAMAEGDFQSLSRSLVRASIDTNVIYIALYDHNGELIASNGAYNKIPTPEVRPKTTFTKSKTTMISSVIVPIDGENYELEIAYSLREIHKNSNEFQITTNRFTVVTIVLCFLIAIIAASTITRPISLLVEAIEGRNIGNGNSEGLIKSNTTGELDILIQRYNAMIKAIAVKDVEVKAAAKEAATALAELSIQKFALDVHSIVGVTDLQGTIVAVNDKFTEISGYSREELLGQNHRLLNSGYHDKSFFDNMYQTLAKGNVWRGEICNRSKDGSIYWVDSTIIRTEKSETHPRRYVAIRNDITDKKQIESDILQNIQEQRIINQLLKIGMKNGCLKEKLADALDSILQIPFLDLSQKGSIFLANHESNELHLTVDKGLATPLKAECKVVPFGKYLYGKAAQTGQLHFSNSDDDNHDLPINCPADHAQYTIPIISKEEVIGVLNLYVAQEHQSKAKEITCLTTISDVLANIIVEAQSQELMIEQQLNLENLSKTLAVKEKLLSSVIDESPGHIFLKSAEGKYLLANRAMADFFGLKPSEMIGHTDQQLRERAPLLPQREKQENQAIDQLSREIIPEERIAVADSFNVWLYTILTPIVIPPDARVNILGFSVDITNDKESREQISASERMSTIGTLASGIAHEFKNFLAGIRSNAEFLQDILSDRNITSEENEVLDNIIDAADDANHVAMGLLTYARQKPDSISCEPVSALVEDTLNLIKRRAAIEGVEIRTTYRPNVVVCVSASKIQQVVLNLLVNALDAITGSGLITIEVDQVEDEAILRVGDSGGGVPMDKRDKIFEPFYSTKAVWSKEKQSKKTGTGLGLSVSRNIISEHHGSIEVLGEEGSGAIFEIRLPAFDLQNEREGAQSNDSEPTCRNILLFTFDERLIHLYQSEASALGITIHTMDVFEEASWISPANDSLIVMDGNSCGTRETLEILKFSRRHSSQTAIVNLPASDAITHFSEGACYTSPKVSNLSEILQNLGSINVIVS